MNKFRIAVFKDTLLELKEKKYDAIDYINEIKEMNR